MNETAVSPIFLEFHTWIRFRPAKENICDCGEAVSYADVSLCGGVAYPPLLAFPSLDGPRKPFFLYMYGLTHSLLEILPKNAF